MNAFAEVEDLNKRKRTADDVCEITKKRLKDNQFLPETVCEKIGSFLYLWVFENKIII